MALGLAVLVQVGFVNGRIAVLGRSADGVVVAVERVKVGRGKRVPIVEFKTAAGEKVVFRGFSQRRSPYEVGDHCRVRYVPSDPSRAEIESWPTLWRALLVASALGIGLIAGGVVINRKAAARAKVK
jgi:hypothetical protein